MKSVLILYNIFSGNADVQRNIKVIPRLLAALTICERFGYNESIKFLCLKINVELRLDYGWIFFNW